MCGTKLVAFLFLATTRAAVQSVQQNANVQHNATQISSATITWTDVWPIQTAVHRPYRQKVGGGYKPRYYRSGRSSQCQQQRFNPRLVRHPGARTCGRRLAAAATPATFSLLLCVHAGRPWPSLIFIRRHAASEVAFPKAQPLRAHLDPTTIGMPLQAHLEPPDRRIVGVHVADLAVVFGLRLDSHAAADEPMPHAVSFVQAHLDSLRLFPCVSLRIISSVSFGA